MAGIFFVSLGCDKNLCDSEHMLYDLMSHGFDLVDDPADAEVIIINSCSFIEDAMQESIDTVIEMGRYKEHGICRALILTGCLGQRFFDDIKNELYEVDAVIGSNSWDKLTEVIDELLSDNDRQELLSRIDDLTGLPRTCGRLRTDPVPTANLKIAEGCNKRCSYCIIPYIRGSYRSVPMEELLDEARTLVDSGVTELSLVAQEVTLYGVDLYGKKSLCRLLKELSAIDGLHWIRLLYCYPEEIDDELIRLMAENEKICHYIDMPIQHCSDSVLKSMGRRTTRADITERIKRIRAAIPDIAIRTTLIAGFPGETEADHQDMLDFVRQMQFDRLGCFAYSQEEGTPAASMPDQIDDDIKSRWVDEIMSTQQEVVLNKNNELIGSILSCFVEGRIDEGVYIARSHRDAPDIDSSVFIETDEELLSGEFVNVKITEAKEYDLIGIPVW
ncbi:MAG: 30S ribosomal protein S12 methylthiotransferase RimO [Lachnospiraceae bacterium]|nr:30S ribosomal protein S12 methylthiotransferase RimO [Lachnospiraceae bacterium]